jgi:hypothetical protein
MTTAFDAIEHVDDPPFHKQGLDSVSPDRYVLIYLRKFNFPNFTLKNLDKQFSRPEHISFVSPQWFLNHRASLNSRVENCETITQFYSLLSS